MDPDHPSRLATMHWHSASGYRQVHGWDPSGTPGQGPPARGAARGARGEISGPGGPPARGAPGGPRGAKIGPPPDPWNGPFLGPFPILFVLLRGGPGGYPLGARFGPGGPPGPGGQKSAHFFGYLITLPVGTVFWDFSAPRDRGPGRGIQDRTAHMGVSGAPPPPVIGLAPGPCPHHAQHARHGPVRLGSMAATGPASASSALVGGT